MMPRKSIALIFLCLLLLPLAGAAQREKYQSPPSISTVRDSNGRYAASFKFKPQTKAMKASLAAAPLYGTLENDVFNPKLDLVLSGKRTVEDALKNIDRSLTDKILKKVNE
ncbi:MAG TPA: hypothetical protein PKW18_11470 [Candidatus Sumerlaeota bacterium]|nr:MAG: hypothetical protein BWY12_00673 [candidate division BRC1 bacterium ADurb.Bin183]HOE63379.1 hypothetical protein [Candidatus Sumerlaeota bacterium]HRR32346.1 hypothetical protein [Candidatus Sumerlaeia bacterium]HON50666.1 hypothetical protein [Candidatus Sumerlaeota bacterium]HOR65216.1 hypothetical protein [Candidatus Sumerlaeota bacterium]